MPWGIQDLQTFLHCVNSYGVLGEHLYFNNSKLTEADSCICDGLVEVLQFHSHVVKHAALTPCCGAPLHKACIKTVKQYMFSCPVCHTSLWQGVPRHLGGISSDFYL